MLFRSGNGNLIRPRPPPIQRKSPNRTSLSLPFSSSLSYVDLPHPHSPAPLFPLFIFLTHLSDSPPWLLHLFCFSSPSSHSPLFHEKIIIINYKFEQTTKHNVINTLKIPKIPNEFFKRVFGMIESELFSRKFNWVESLSSV